MPYSFGKLGEKHKGPLITIVSCAEQCSYTHGLLFPDQPISLQNYKRVIEVWWEEKYKEFFYTREPLARYLDHGDITKQLEMKKRLNCKSFAWFMENVAPDQLLKYPELPRNLHWGELKNIGSKACLDSMGRPAPTKMGVSGCHGYGNNQVGFRENFCMCGLRSFKDMTDQATYFVFTAGEAECGGADWHRRTMCRRR